MANRKSPVFIREATGLVREIGLFEHYMININGVGLIFAPAFTAWFIWYAVPGGSVPIASISGFLFGAFGYLTAFALVSATFPRTAAPYVAESRILHPAIGWPVESMLWLSILSFAAIVPSAYLIAWGLAPGLFVFGTLTNNAALVNLASWISTSNGIIVAGTIFLLVSFIPAILGTKTMVKTFQTPLFIIGTLGFFVTVGVLLSSSNAQFVSNFNMLEANIKYNDILTLGKQLNPSAFVPASYGLGTYLASVALTGGSMNSYWNAWAVGEFKNARSLKRQIPSMVLTSLALTLSILIIVALEEGIVGHDQMVALTQIGSFSPSTFSNALFGGGVITPSIPYVATSNPWVVLFMMIAIIAGAFTFMPVNWLIASRDPFAWAFDRLIPEKFASINERFHTPVFTLIFSFIIVEAFLILAATTSLLGLLFTVTWVWSGFAIGITCLACALLPLRKEMWDQSPARRYKIAGIPIVTIVGIIGFFYQMDVSVAYTLIPALGFGTQQTGLIVGSYVAVFILYWVVKAIRKHQGIAIENIFRTIPPE